MQKHHLKFLIGATLAVSLSTTSATAATVTVSQVAGRTSDAYATGMLLEDGQAVGSWILNTTVSNTEFENDALSGGESGLQYTMMNAVRGSSDVNNVTFTAALNSTFLPALTLTQSPYLDNEFTWNGANIEASQMSLSWIGMGLATISDPANQLRDLATGAEVTSGATVIFNNQVYNDEDAWSIALPKGASSVQVAWSSSEPLANSDLTREWITFQVDAMPVPEPTGWMVALIGLVGIRRRRR